MNNHSHILTPITHTLMRTDFEDSSAPTWSVVTEGQRNLRDAVNGTIR